MKLMHGHRRQVRVQRSIEQDASLQGPVARPRRALPGERKAVMRV